MTVPRIPADKLPRITEEQLGEQMERLAGQYGYPGTPNNETSFSGTFFNEWLRIFSPYTFKQIEKAISTHIDSDDSLKGVFPLPGRIKKLIKYDQTEYEIICDSVGIEKAFADGEITESEYEEKMNEIIRERVGKHE